MAHGGSHPPPPPGPEAATLGSVAGPLAPIGRVSHGGPASGNRRPRPGQPDSPVNPVTPRTPRPGRRRHRPATPAGLGKLATLAGLPARNAGARVEKNKGTFAAAPAEPMAEATDPAGTTCHQAETTFRRPSIPTERRSTAILPRPPGWSAFARTT